MFTIDQRHELLHAIDGLDYFQKQKVLEFIRGISYPSPEEIKKQQVKRAALKEIRKALGSR